MHGETSTAGAARAVTSPPVAPAVTRPLHVCPDCASKLVYPVWWQEHGRDHWSIELRCPNCEWAEGGVFCQRQADAFDHELDRGTDAVAVDLDRLVRANMTEVADRFAHALAAGAILPEDF